VEVGISPSESDLEDVVQISNGAITADGQTPPDDRTDAE